MIQATLVWWYPLYDGFNHLHQLRFSGAVLSGASSRPSFQEKSQVVATENTFGQTTSFPYLLITFAGD